MTLPRTSDRAIERHAMVRDQLAARGITDERVLAVMAELPREAFVSPESAALAYADRALPVACGQTISQPYIVARMTELLQLTRQARVLEVGGGTGYQTSILSRLAGEVFSIEWHLPLMRAAAQRLRELECRNVALRCGDGTLGWPEHAPFDAILVAAGGPEFPDALEAQLAPGGRMVIPVGTAEAQTLYLVERVAAARGAADPQALAETRRATPAHPGDGFRRTPVLQCRFVRLEGVGGWRA